jgi:hypothetical protein
VRPEDFRAAFTTARGWGTFEQKRSADQQTDAFMVKWGTLRLGQIGLDVPGALAEGAVSALLNNAPVAVERVERNAAGHLEVRLAKGVDLNAGDRLMIQVTAK